MSSAVLALLVIKFLVILSLIPGTKNHESILLEPRPLSMGETQEINHLNDSFSHWLEAHNFNSLKLTFHGIQIHYDVQKQYTFAPPTVEITCKCSCSRSKKICGLGSSTNYDRCVHYYNATTVCNTLQSVGKNASVCRDHYHLCCQSHFSLFTHTKKSYALKLRNPKPVFNVSITIQKFSGKYICYSLLIPYDINHVLFSWPLPFMLYVKFKRPKEFLPEEWYYIEEGTNHLKTTRYMNGRNEENFKKHGWFQISSKNRINPLSEEAVKKFLKIKVENCMSSPPIYDWDLEDVFYFYKERNTYFPDNGHRVIDVYQEIKNISIDLRENVAIADMNFDENIQLMTSTISFHTSDYDFVFTAAIKPTHSKNLEIKIKGKGQHSFYLFVHSSHHPLPLIKRIKTRKLPFSFGIKLPFSYSQKPIWVCIAKAGDHGQMNRQLNKVCQIIQRDTSCIPVKELQTEFLDAELTSTRSALFLPVEFDLNATIIDINSKDLKQYLYIIFTLAFIGCVLAFLLLVAMYVRNYVDNNNSHKASDLQHLLGNIKNDKNEDNDTNINDYVQLKENFEVKA